MLISAKNVKSMLACDTAAMISSIITQEFYDARRETIGITFSITDIPRFVSTQYIILDGIQLCNMLITVFNF